MDKDKFLQTGLIEQYVLGLTNEEESKEVERYAAAYPEIQQEIKAMRNALDQYARQYAIMPPEELKGRVMEDIGEERAPEPSGTRSNGYWSSIVGIAAIVLIGLLAVLSASFYQGKLAAESQYQSLSAQFDSFKEACEEEKERLRQVQQVYAFINHSATLPVALTGTSLAPEARSVAYINPQEQRAYINVSQLPPLPKGKTYQLWADVEGEMINMGVLQKEGAALQAVHYIGEAESLNITLEPEGGSEEPTVEQLLVNGKV